MCEHSTVMAQDGYGLVWFCFLLKNHNFHDDDIFGEMIS